jgi:hypothetical protein
MYFPSFPEAPTMQTFIMCDKPPGALILLLTAEVATDVRDSIFAAHDREELGYPLNQRRLGLCPAKRYES